MRAALIPVVFVAPLILGACASNKTFPTYQQEYDRLSAECTKGGGILTTSGAQTGRPQTDYVCKIIGSPTRIPRN
ncbi:hypothetical protein [Brevundimonas sp. NPDC046655]|jgi:hypothetical protein|uniref:hypothetical protein n=1 Tax=unclassified Brevundimonas TaxID=2622653 RepID=UPI00384D243F